MGERPKLHAIIISPAYQGHINPFVNLALKLASKGITITFINFQHVHHLQSQARGTDTDLFSQARASGLDIRFTTVSDGFPLEFDRELHCEEYFTRFFFDELPARTDELVERIMAEFGSPWINFLVTDTVFFPAPSIARKYNIAAVSFWTESALVFSLMYHLEILKERGHYPCRDDAEEEITYIPGVSSINTKDFMPNLKESHPQGILSKVLLKAFEEVRKTDFILHNTMEEIEPEILTALNQHQPNYAIGPINFFENSISSTPDSKSLWPEYDCTDWLKSKPPGEVLYVSFGSFINASKEFIIEIAHGLLLSEVNFIWVLRPGILIHGDTNSFSDEFRGKIKEKGLIIPWCNQVKVLSDPAVGGFLTHNGWNSTIESVWCGVPTICYPIDFDQLINRKLMVDDWKVGLNLRDGKSVDRTHVAEKIRSLFKNAEISNLRKRVYEVKKKFHDAVQDGGSSNRNFDQFVEGVIAKTSNHRNSSHGWKAPRFDVLPPHQGHLISAINQALKLASKGFTITFVIFEYIHQMLSDAHNQATTEFNLFSRADKSVHNIHYTTISDGLPDDFDREVRLTSSRVPCERISPTRG